MPSEAFPFTRLKDCGTIRSGQSFRKALLEDPNSRHFVIQTKDLLPEGHISQTLMPVSLMGEKPKPNVEPGDLLILSRAVRFNAESWRASWAIDGTSTCFTYSNHMPPSCFPSSLSVI